MPPRKRTIEKLCRHLLNLTSTEIASNELRRSAVVFSPHPDDESLGCGGTIIKKKKVGASVSLVHMTDGSASTNLISKEQLKAIRKRESLNAGRILGVNDTYFLDFEDSKLSGSVLPATDRVLEILRKESPEEIFIPYCHEPIRQAADHVAATNIVLAALRRHQRKVTVWEYPVWFWLHWPWVGIRQNSPPIKSKHVLWNSLLSFFGVRALVDLKYSVHIGDVLEEKRAALAEHKSQMEQLIPDARWVTLRQLSYGEFLACFYQDREFFRRYDFQGPGGRTSRVIHSFVQPFS
jgi:LmbE family N-acetylglucosaminyl deacetylase